jgi:hypothetical protein
MDGSAVWHYGGKTQMTLQTDQLFSNMAALHRWLYRMDQLFRNIVAQTQMALQDGTAVWHYGSKTQLVL